MNHTNNKLNIKTISKYATIGGAGILVLTAGASVLRNIGQGQIPPAMTFVTLLVGVAALTYTMQDESI